MTTPTGHSPSSLSYFNPFSDEHHAIADFSKISFGEKCLTLSFTALVAPTILIGLGFFLVPAVFRVMTEHYYIQQIDPKNPDVSGTVVKVHGQGGTVLSTPEKSDFEQAFDAVKTKLFSVSHNFEVIPDSTGNFGVKFTFNSPEDRQKFINHFNHWQHADWWTKIGDELTLNSEDTALFLATEVFVPAKTKLTPEMYQKVMSSFEKLPIAKAIPETNYNKETSVTSVEERFYSICEDYEIVKSPDGDFQVKFNFANPDDRSRFIIRFNNRYAGPAHPKIPKTGDASRYEGNSLILTSDETWTLAGFRRISGWKNIFNEVMQQVQKDNSP